MYRIGICDDEIKTCNQLEEYINNYLEQHYMKGEIEVFYSGESLCKFLKRDEKFNIIFLDIELPKINGVQVGEYLREHLKDEITDIVYISGKIQYALKLFANRPLDFIVKPIQYERVKRVLDILVRRSGITEMYFEYQIDKITRTMPLQNILYFKSDNKKVHMILNSGEEIIFSGKLGEIKEKLPEKYFLQIHKSYVINHRYVIEYSSDCIKMSNGDYLNISKAYRKNVKMQLMQYEL